MKKFVYSIVCLGAALWTVTPALHAKQLTPSQALMRASKAESPESGVQCSKVPANAVPAYTMQANDLNTLYVFNLDGGGFMIVSADDVGAPVLGYSDTGMFDKDNIPPNLQGWLSGYSAQIEQGVQQDVAAYSAGAEESLSGASPVTPLTHTLWNQSAPYNYRCPVLTEGTTEARAVTGCVATAMAQVMKAHNWPLKGAGSKTYSFTFNGQSYTETLDFGDTYYYWDKMLDYYTAESTVEEEEAVASLMYSCGVSVGMDYGLSESGAQGFNAGVALLKYFDYDKGIKYLSHSYIPCLEWAQTIYDEVEAGRPVLYFGQGAEGGHAFVCDGYSSHGFFHFNWGWGGLSDGYFILTALDPPALGIGGAGGGFNADQQIIVGIRPPVEGSTPSAVMVLQGVLLPEQQSYTSDQTITFTGVEGSVFLGSLSLSDITATLGFKLTDSQGNVQYIQSEVVNHDFAPMSGVGSVSAFASEFPQGTYTITPAYQYEGQWSDVKTELGYPYTLTATSDGQTVNFTATQKQSAISVTSFTQDTQIYMDALCKFQASITATGDYYGNVTPVLMQSGSVVGEATSLPVALSAGESNTYTWVTKFSGTYLTAGTYTLIFVDENGYAISSEYTVTVNAASTETPAVDVSTVTFAGTTGTGRASDPVMLDANNIDITVQLNCTQGYWADYVEGMFFDMTTMRSVANTGSKFIGLESGATGSVTLTGKVSNLTEGEKYYFTPWAVNKSEQMGSAYVVEIKDSMTDAVPTVSDSTPAVYYNLQGEQMPTGATLNPGIYIVRRGGVVQKAIVR